MSLTQRISCAHGMIRSIANVLLGWTYPSLTIPRKDMTGKTAIITGANSGIGFVIARELASQGADVYLACRSSKKGQEAIEKIREFHPNARVTLLTLDTSSLDSCRDFASKWRTSDRPSIDLLIHNAGVAAAPEGKEITDDGLEYIYQTNFLSSFLVTRLLATELSSDARVVFNSSAAAYSADLLGEFSLERVAGEVEEAFHGLGGRKYGQSKLMQIAFARALRGRWNSNDDGNEEKVEESSRKMAVAFAPGYTSSSIFDSRNEESMDWATRTLVRFKGTLATPTEQGAATGIWLSVEERDNIGDGLFFERMGHLTCRADLLSQDTLDRLWIRWSKDVGLEAR